MVRSVLKLNASADGYHSFPCRSSTQPRASQWFASALSTLLRGSQSPQMVELKNGETFNGHLVNCDNFMNITLREVYQTNSEGDRFFKIKECYIRGSTVNRFAS